MIPIPGPSTTGDDSPQLQAALNALRPKETLSLGYGRYRVFSPLVCLDKVIRIEGDGAFLDWRGKAGTLLTLGFAPGNPAAGGLAGSGWSIRGITFHHTGTAEPLMQNPSTALCLQNVYAGSFDIDIDCFGVGLSLIGDGTGCTYNRFNIQQLIENQTSLKVRTANGGFVTRSQFDGGRWQYGPGAKGIPVMHMDILGPNVGTLEFLGCSYEGWPTCTVAAIDHADGNLWQGCSYESTSGAKMPFILGANATRQVRLGAFPDDVTWMDGNKKPLPGMANVNRPNW